MYAILWNFGVSLISSKSFEEYAQDVCVLGKIHGTRPSLGQSVRRGRGFHLWMIYQAAGASGSYEMAESLNPAAPHHLPGFITAPGSTDVLMVIMAIVLVLSILAFG